MRSKSRTKAGFIKAKIALDGFKNIEGYLFVFKMIGKNHRTAVKTKKQKKDGMIILDYIVLHIQTKEMQHEKHKIFYRTRCP
ncbi:MAG: hypothetical protein MUC80_00610 [Candidatus Thermoplasmatota archaeon]|nr:hypothetical protein [Candidatus Thermoplasmatota archaeon]